MFSCNYKPVKSIKPSDSLQSDDGLSLNKSDTIPDERDDDECSTVSSSGKSTARHNSKVYKRQSDACYALNLFETQGRLLTRDINDKALAIIKIHNLTFPDSTELFEKGKFNLGNYFKEDSKNIPDITFWYQRYYYYKKFDEGIKMDYESNRLLID